MELKVRNVNELFSEMFWKFRAFGVPSDSRNGKVLMIPEPVLTTIERPMERALLYAPRDANPIFHLMEGLWMLSGRRDVEFVRQFNSKIGQYSDDGRVFNAAYGHRMREHFGFDQLISAISTLRSDPDSRQCVVQLWDAADLQKTTKDKACNMQLLFSVRFGKLDMLVINRSNDAWWGYAGANPVHFSMIQEFVASALGIPVGIYRTFTNNLHLYTELYDNKGCLDNPPTQWDYDAYSHGIQPTPIISTDWQRWLLDCEHFCSNPYDETRGYHDPFFKNVAHPMAMVSKVRRDKTGDGYYWAERVGAEDWKLAVKLWISNREKAKYSS